MATVTDIHIIYADFFCCLGIKCNLWAVFFIAIFNTSGKKSSYTCGKYADSDKSSVLEFL